MSTNSKDSVLGVLRGGAKRGGHVPNFSGMGSITLHGIQQLGYRFNEIHVDARKMAAAAASTHRLFGFESAVVPFDMGVVAESLGATVKYYDKADQGQIIYPTMTRKVIDRTTVNVPEGLSEADAKTFVMKEIERQITDYELHMPADIANTGRIPVVLEAIRILKREIGDAVAIGSWTLGPFTELGQVMDLEVLLKMSAKKPDVVKRHLSFMVDYLEKVLDLHVEAGADFVTVREMGATASILSPRMFKSLVLPALQDLFGRIKSVPRVLHICGDTNPIVELMAESGADALSVDQMNRLNETRAKLPHVVLLGNYKPFGAPFCEGTPEEVDTMIKEAIAQGADAIWPGCDIWPVVPVENMKAMMEAMKKYGVRV
ncbi:MAG TPA: uroporphyrinogen decarboxylase family protein [Anaerolineae bacterium]|nr:uroporphyrinogen decarboxylase family protein [Anaerolineae bacterium]